MRLSYEFTWEHATAENGEAATWGHLRVLLGSKQLWGATEKSAALGVYWTWIEMLEHLAGSWPWLIGEQGWPPNILPADMPPAEFAAERRSALERAGAHRSRIEQTLFDFRERHDLSFALKGKLLPSLWIVRQGNDAWVGDAYEVLSWPEVMDFLVGLGNAIVERLKVHQDERAIHAITQWEDRENADAELRAEAITGLDSARLRALIGSEETAVALEIIDSGFESSELAFAARLAGPSLKVETVKKLLGCIRKTALGVTSPVLHAMSQAASRQKFQSEFAYEEGWHLARWLRHELQIDTESRIDPDELFAHWGVVLSSIDLDDPGVDAVACWGPRHGPAVYVNTSGRRAQDVAGRRATEAHEIAHLLVDRDRALPLSEIQGWIHRGRVEKRANAFAAELLMPRSVAGERLASCDSRDSTRNTVIGLSKDFGVSREIIAWQAVRSPARLSDPVLEELAMYVPDDRRWQIFAARNT